MSQTTNIQNLAAAVATDVARLSRLVTGSAQGTDLSGLTTTAKSSLVAALNELQQAVQAAASSGGAAINDATSTTTTTWSSSKIGQAISAATSALVDSSPAALDTLKELAAALGNDANFSATITTALGNRVRVDAAQTLTTGQQAQARTNIGAASAADVGDTSTDFAAYYATSKASA
jgi:hypothetical protein